MIWDTTTWDFTVRAEPPPNMSMHNQSIATDELAGNTVNLDVTGNITAAAQEGIILDRHCGCTHQA